MTDIINDISEQLAERIDVEIAREFITSGVKMLCDNGIKLNISQSMTSMHATDNQLFYETAIMFSGIDTSEHDKKVIDEYKNRVLEEIELMYKNDLKIIGYVSAENLLKYVKSSLYYFSDEFKEATNE